MKEEENIIKENNNDGKTGNVCHSLRINMWREDGFKPITIICFQEEDNETVDQLVHLYNLGGLFKIKISIFNSENIIFLIHPYKFTINLKFSV